MRTCVGCRRSGDRTDWQRISADPEGGFGVGSRAHGRGAWLCSSECFDLSVRRKALARALRRDLPNELVAQLRARLFADGS